MANEKNVPMYEYDTFVSFPLKFTVGSRSLVLHPMKFTFLWYTATVFLHTAGSILDKGGNVFPLILLCVVLWAIYRGLKTIWEDEWADAFKELINGRMDHETTTMSAEEIRAFELIESNWSEGTS